ncbi:hypothetical protein HYALB_00012342 [Hymenoscyphus albidus]|uniref:Uncharacterized protein n=1 Tax=Hymenoscyphus albidus TaxID=595503 RepID=A0A9N9LMW5_9HELO|nr:hypothetical protein HYALB_00012342 [Hymenoscyphus albidus]
MPKMLLYARRAPPKESKKRSRAERGLKCEYEAVKPRKRRRSSCAGSVFSADSQSPIFCDEPWPGRFESCEIPDGDNEVVQKWEVESEYQQFDLELPVYEWDVAWDNRTERKYNNCAEPQSPTQLPGCLVRSRSQYPDLAMIAPSPVASPLLEFNAPLYMEFSDKSNRRALVDHFCNVLSHLIVFKEDTGNPFRQLVLPLSHGCSPVMNAIFALSSAHLEYGGVENEEKSLTFHNMALQGLAQLIEQNDQIHREEVLAAIMILVYYEVLVQKGKSNIVNGHLKGAMTIMKSGPRICTPAGLFLERAFRFYDVIAALSFGTCPTYVTQPIPTAFPTEDGEDQSFNNSPLDSVDTLLGLSTDLWPIINQLSHLLSFKRSLEEAIAAGETTKARRLRRELESASQAIEDALTDWKPVVSPNPLSPNSESNEQPIDLPDARIQSILNNAEAYRNSAFVYLYHTIHSQSISDILVQRHAHLSLIACANVVKNAEQCHDGPMSALLWPLFVAACVAMTEEDRELALDAFGGTERRQKMNNIMRAREVVEEVWRRTDLGENHVNWMDISKGKGYNIVFG